MQMQSSLRLARSGGLQLLVCFLLLYSRPGSCSDVNTHDGQGQVASGHLWPFQGLIATIFRQLQLILHEIVPQGLFSTDDLAEEVLNRKVGHLNRLHLPNPCRKSGKAAPPTATTGVSSKQEEKLGLLYPKSPAVKVNKDRCFVTKVVPKAPAPKQEATHPPKAQCRGFRIVFIILLALVWPTEGGSLGRSPLWASTSLLTKTSLRTAPFPRTLLTALKRAILG